MCSCTKLVIIFNSNTVNLGILFDEAEKLFVFYVVIQAPAYNCLYQVRKNQIPMLKVINFQINSGMFQVVFSIYIMTQNKEYIIFYQV